MSELPTYVLKRMFDAPRELVWKTWTDPALLPRFLKMREYGGNPLPMPVQATSAALWNEESHVAANRALYTEKFDLAERADIGSGLQGKRSKPGGGADGA